ncbi:hypothetical protein KFL_012480020 [Klebsormidium nitens]|uniref:IPT/TIG domain-containing protein n=1 Tax=Klebsormidium nitens TaxID=105231 RepID=A0A1Y1IUH7_KLENI|nr:hypothetical protein KFL_012480020 [Klebsormidium nitens]|eukprot:GAQ93011.1 hypothetical protein KFL_012480020 [Klebsormidium nitens]
MSGDGFPEDGYANLHLDRAPLPPDKICPISWCEQFAVERGACRDAEGNLTVHCSAAKVRGSDLQPCGDYLRRRSIAIIQRYRLRYRLRQLLAAARLSREALGKGFSIVRFQPTLASPEGGSTLTISKTGFAAAVPGLLFEARVDGKLCPSVQVRSDPQLLCVVPPGSGSCLKVDVTPIVEINYGGPYSPLSLDIKLETLSLTGFAYKGPTIDRVVPAELPTSGGRLTLYGSSKVGVGQVSINASGQVACSVVNVQSDHVVVDVGPGTGSGKHLLTLAVFLAGPVVTELDTNGISEYPTWTRNESFVLNGQNFGPLVGAPLIKVTVGGVPTGARLCSEHTSLIVDVPPGAGGVALVQVSVDELTSLTSPSTCISYARPHVLSCTKSGVSGGYFAVSGRHFGTGISSSLVVTVGGKACAGVNLLNPHTKIEALVPEGAGTNLPIGVQIAGVDATVEASCSFSYSVSISKPKSSSIGPDSSEVINLFCQAQLARYYKNGIRQAELDVFGLPFTTESAKKASEIWKELEPKIRRMQNKVNKDILVNTITKAWQALKKTRGLSVEENPKSKKRNTT